jgi:hypothetical protein
MSEPTPDAAPEQVDQQPAPEAEQPKTYDEAYVEKLRKEAASYRSKLREEEQARRASMTEAERAVVEAEERGRQSAVTAYGQRLARTEFIAEAAKRNPGFDAAQILDDLNLARYIGEDGEPDSKAITKAVQRLIPEAGAGTPQPPSFDGGSRQPAPGGMSMSDLIRQAAGRA